MRIAIVTPYSWTYPGGVNFHVEALAEELLGSGDDVRVLAPWDPPDSLSRRLHRGAAAEIRERPDYLLPLGRTVGFAANGAVSNLSVFPDGVQRMRHELRTGDYDVVHIHEPPAPSLSWDACSHRGAPVVGTFHAYSTKAVPNHIASLIGARRKFNQLSARIAVSEAAAWTGRRWFGGAYEIIPNGVEIDPPDGPEVEGSEGMRILFVGRPEERKGLPVLLNAFSALAAHAPAKLIVIGAEREQVARMAPAPEMLEHVECRGRVEREELWAELRAADLLCAPSLSGESFGMVLTEAFAAGTPVVASAIAGYSDVVTDGVDGILVPPGDAQTLAETLHGLYASPRLLREMGESATRSAERYAWPAVARRVREVYERAICPPQPDTVAARAATRIGIAPVTGERVPARRLDPLDAEIAAAPRGRRRARTAGIGLAGVAGVGLSLLAVRQVGLDHLAASFVRSSPSWVLVAFALMVASMLLRAVSWHAIAAAALPHRRVRRRDIASGTMIGVLMSATLPARLGEPARATVVSRRVGRVRETFPVLIGTLVSQTLLNILALVALGVIIVSTTDLFQRNQEAVFAVSTIPVLLLVAVLTAPLLVRTSGDGRMAQALVRAKSLLIRVRSGLRVFRQPRAAAVATSAQLAAWGLQLLSCYVLLRALELDTQVGIGAAAAALFAVNVTAVVPATPSNIGIFQVAVISVLTTGYGVAKVDALAYGIILQAVEIATAVAVGVPALVREGFSWSDMRVRALQAAPVTLPGEPAERPGDPAIARSEGHSAR